MSYRQIIQTWVCIHDKDLITQTFLQFKSKTKDSGCLTTPGTSWHRNLVLHQSLIFHICLLLADCLFICFSVGFESSAASVHIPDLGNVSTVPTEALPNRNYYSHTPGYSNPLYTIPGSPPTAEEEDDADTSSLNLQEFGNFSEA